MLADADLYLRGAETLLASWEEYARGATGAAVQRSPLMPSWKGALTPQQIQDVIAYLRTLAVPPYRP